MEFISFLNYGMHFFELIKLFLAYFQITKIESQLKTNEHFRHIFTFNKGSTAAIAACDICGVYGEGVIVEGTDRDWER